MWRLYRIYRYHNSQKIRRRGIVMEGDKFVYGSYSYVLIGYDSIKRIIVLARFTSLSHVDMKMVDAESIECEWGK